MTIRHVQPDDAENFVEMLRVLDAETKFMMFEPGERSLDIEGQRKRLASVQNATDQVLFVVEETGRLIGFLSGVGGGPKRVQHRFYIVMGLLESHRGKGFGTKLLEKFDEWARAHQVHRAELTVMTHNTTAVRLYEKMGFTREGVRKDSMKIDGRFVDEYHMAKIYR